MQSDDALDHPPIHLLTHRWVKATFWECHHQQILTVTKLVVVMILDHFVEKNLKFVWQNDNMGNSGFNMKRNGLPMSMLAKFWPNFRQDFVRGKCAWKNSCKAGLVDFFPSHSLTFKRTSWTFCGSLLNFLTSWSIPFGQPIRKIKAVQNLCIQGFELVRWAGHITCQQ